MAIISDKNVSADNLITVAAASLLSASAVMVFNAQPVIMGVATDSMGLSPAQMGVLASAEIGGIGLASVAAVFVLSRLNWRTTAIAGLLVMLLGNLLCIYLDRFVPMVITRFLIGFFGEGVVFAIAYAVFGDGQDADRAFALSIAAQVGLGMLGLWAFPLIAEPWGYAGVVASLAIIAMLSLLLVYWIPQQGTKDTPLGEVLNDQVRPSLVAIFSGLAVITLWFTGLSGVWAFIERAGIASGMAQSEVGSILALGMGLGMLGALLAAWAGDRFGRYWPPAFSLILHAILSIILLSGAKTGLYIAGVLLFTFVWNLGLPYLLGLVASADISGRYVVLLIAATASGNTLGPAIAGAVADAQSLQQISYTASGLCLLALALYVFFTRALKQLIAGNHRPELI